MKSAALLACALLGCVADPAAPSGEVVPFHASPIVLEGPDAALPPLVFGVIGQSNAEGRANVAQVTTIDGLEVPVPSITLSQMMGRGLAIYADGPLAPRTPDAPVPNDFGVELTMGRRLAESTGRTISIVKVAVGGSSLQGDWLGPDNYTLDAMAFVEEKSAAIGGEVGGLVWIQGETDASNPAYAANYGANLATMTGMWWARWPGVRFAVVRLHADNVGAYKADVRAAQVARQGVVIVEADDLANDGLHFGADAIAELGNRSAEAFQ